MTDLVRHPTSPSVFLSNPDARKFAEEAQEGDGGQSGQDENAAGFMKYGGLTHEKAQPEEGDPS